MSIARVIAFIKLGRFLFLTGGFVFFGLGAAIAWYSGAPINWPMYLWGQIVVTSAQLMVHYGNDYYDYAADKANESFTFWSGGSRVLPNGELPVQTARIASIAFGLIALLAALYLTVFLRPGPMGLPLLLLAIGLGWNYSAPPLRLNSNGWGEITSTGIIAFLTPLAGCYLQAGTLEPLVFAGTLPLILLQFNMLLSVNAPDAAGDTAAGKQTLVVIFGERLTRRLYIFNAATAYAVLPILVLVGLPPLVAASVGATLPIGMWLILYMWRKYPTQPGQWSSLIFGSISLLMGAAALEMLLFAGLA